jgi:hypothetical protein
MTSSDDNKCYVEGSVEVECGHLLRGVEVKTREKSGNVMMMSVFGVGEGIVGGVYVCLDEWMIGKMNFLFPSHVSSSYSTLSKTEGT